MEKQENKKNRKEHIIGFVYVSTLFVITTVICCVCLSYYGGKEKVLVQKEFAMVKKERMQKFQSLQSEKVVLIDSLYNKIKNFNHGVKANYEEEDIIYYINDIKRIYTDNSYDGRYKIFLHISNFYNMWFYDRKEVWSKAENVANFRKNLENCELGLQKKKEELKKN